MNIRQKFANLIKMNDFFNSRELLRIEKENDYRTITGGLLSTTIIVVIIIGFAKMFIDTFNLSIISYTSKIDKQMTPGPINLTATSQSNFMFGLQLGALSQVYERFNLSSNIRYFDFTVLNYKLQSGVIVDSQQIPLQACTRQHWRKVQDSVQNFDKLNVTNWLCPKLKTSIQLFGKYTNTNSSMIQILGSPCRNETDPNRLCASPEQIDQYFSRVGDQFYLTIYYINTLINPDQQNYLSYYLQDMTYLGFGKKMGNQIHLQFEEFMISSDYSIWPFQDLKQDRGFIISDKVPQYPFQIKSSDSMYFIIALWRSDKSYSYKREVQKISATFSFMGGLIGAVVAVLFIINSFTHYSYQISLAIQIFKKQEGTQEDEQLSVNNQIKKTDSIQQPNIFQYIRFNFYQLRKFFCKNTYEVNLEKIDKYRQEVLKQLDVKLLIRRLIFIQFCLKHVFEDYQLVQLQQNFPSTPQQVKFIREDFRKTQKIICKTEKVSEDSFNDCGLISCLSGQVIQKNKTFRSQNLNAKLNCSLMEESPNLSYSSPEFIQLKKRIYKVYSKEDRSAEDETKIQKLLKLFEESKKGNKISERILQTTLCRLEANIESQILNKMEDQLKLNNVIEIQNKKKLPIISFQIPIEKNSQARSQGKQ